MNAPHFRSFALLATLVAGFGALGCGPEFDPPTEIKTLRILGVQKDRPYAEPGDEVNFTMLWHDGSPKAADENRQVNIAWLDACVNPPGDAYSGCFEQIGQRGACIEAAQASPDDELRPEDCGPFHVGFGPKFSITIPRDGDPGVMPPVLHPSQDPFVPPYGVSYVFFALCAGTPGIEAGGITCRDTTDTSSDPRGRKLDSENFVLGYSAVYSFARKIQDPAQSAPSLIDRDEPYLNHNPFATGFLVGPADVTDVSCVGDACLGSCGDAGCENLPLPAQVDCDTHRTLCIAPCAEDGDIAECPPTNLRPIIDKALVVEPDEVTNGAYKRGFLEQQWIDYYSTKGAFRSPTKLLNDATRGFNPDHGTQFYAPKESGPVQIWAVIHDNRGGMSWVGTTLHIGKQAPAPPGGEGGAGGDGGGASGAPSE
jgi:hypothetical protein